MSLHVFFDIGLLCKGPPTHNALEGLLSGVGAYVLLEVKVLHEGLVTVVTLELLLLARGLLI